jgi:hypothetical protein
MVVTLVESFVGLGGCSPAVFELLSWQALRLMSAAKMSNGFFIPLNVFLRTANVIESFQL